MGRLPMTKDESIFRQFYVRGCSIIFWISGGKVVKIPEWVYGAASWMLVCMHPVIDVTQTLLRFND